MMAANWKSRLSHSVRISILAGLILLSISCAAKSAMAYCVECHQEFSIKFSSKSVHEPYREDCLNCHLEHFGRGVLLLTSQGNDLCRECHETEEDDFIDTHHQLPVQKIACIGCHDPHASGKIKLLKTTIHRPLAYGQCIDCHGDDGRLLAKSVAELCYKCHDSQSFIGVSVHAPVESGDCLECHDPHGSSYPALMSVSYTLERFLPFSEETYGLCFSCHDSSPIQTPDKDKAETGFKDNNDNLHYLHAVNRRISDTSNIAKESTACRNCHLPHASDIPRLIRKKLDCGEGVLCLRLEYTISGGTATCTAGCHQPASYATEAGEADFLALPGTSSSEREEARSMPQEEDIFCLDCHEDDWERFQKSNMHDPVRKKRCDDCHMDHGQDDKLILLAYEGRLCSRCHEEKLSSFTDSHSGYDVRGSHCGQCHDPHSSVSKGLLYEVTHEPFEDRSCDDCHDSDDGKWPIGKPINDICSECHDDQFEHSHLHGAIREQSCAGCHDPHTASEDMLLRDEMPALCYRCHNPKKYMLAFRHEPLSDGQCDNCHDPHGTENPNILTAAYPDERYRDFNMEEYALCFSCHDEEPFTNETSHNTSFRQGDVNLHYPHVNTRQVPKEIGMKTIAGYSCRNCHEPHSTTQPVLIREALDCGGVPCLNLDFKKIGDSGRCSRGCHTPKVYSP